MRSSTTTSTPNGSIPSCRTTKFPRAPARSGRRAALPRDCRRPTATSSCIRTGGPCRRRSSRAGSTASCARAWPISSARRRRAALDRPPGRGLHHLEHAPRRRAAPLRRPAGKPLEGVRLQLLRRRGFPPPQLRADHPQHAGRAPRLARRGPQDRAGTIPSDTMKFPH